MSMDVNTGGKHTVLSNDRVFELAKSLEGKKLSEIGVMRIGKMTRQDGLQLTEEAAKQQEEVKERIANTVHKVENPIATFQYGAHGHFYGKVEIDGVTFKKEEVNSVSAILRPAFSDTMQSKVYYDYRDYGEMGVAEGAVMTYCRNNLTEGQSAVVQKYVSQYFDQMSKKQEPLLESGEYKTSAQIGFPGNKYYDMWAAVSSSKTGIKPEKNTNQDKNNPDIQWFKTGWATDKDTISYIRNLFREMDVTDEESVKNTMKQYRERMGAVYSYQSYTGADVADYDIRTFMEQIAKRRAVLDRYMGGGIDTMI